MKLLVLDIDGTLVNSRKEITPPTLAALHRWRAAGNAVAIASGRPTAGVREVAAAIHMAEEGGYILSYNGGCITDARTGRVVWQKQLPISLPAQLADYAHAHSDLGLITYQGDVVLSLKEPDRYVYLEAVTINKMELRHHPDFADLTFAPPKCLFTAPPASAGAYEAELASLFGDRASIYRSEDFFIEVMPTQVNKANALEEFIPLLGIDRADVIAVGDGHNDLSMIRWAGLGVAMANAQPSVKAAADRLTLSCDEDGVAALIEELLAD